MSFCAVSSYTVFACLEGVGVGEVVCCLLGFCGVVLWSGTDWLLELFSLSGVGMEIVFLLGSYIGTIHIPVVISRSPCKDFIDLSL